MGFLRPFHQWVAPFLTSKGATLKLHKLAMHAVPQIQRLGGLRHQSSGDFESHMRATKKLHR